MIEIKGIVIHGKGLGHQFGMPTANIDCDCSVIEKGVYAGYAFVGDQRYCCIVNVGTRPSVDNSPIDTAEALLIDFNGNLYGQMLQVQLLHYLRPIQKFDGIEAVKEQVEKDKEKALMLMKQT